MAALHSMSLARAAASTRYGILAPVSMAFKSRSKSRQTMVVRASACGPKPKSYKISLLPGDGIGPEVLKVAVDVLQLVGSHEGSSSHLLSASKRSVFLSQNCRGR